MGDALPNTIKAWTWNSRTDSGQWHANGQGDVTEYIRADLAKPRVKPLVWERSTHKKHDGSVEYAETSLGTYFICYDSDDFTGFYCDFVYLGNSTWFGTGGANTREIESHYHDDDLTELKAAAQADYEARILACLDGEPDPNADPLRAKMEAIIEKWDGMTCRSTCADELRKALEESH